MNTHIIRILCSGCLILTLLPLTSQADVINVSAAVWGTARDDGRNGSFDSISDPDSIVLQRIPNANFVERAAWEFDLSELPSGTITNVTLFFDLVSTTLERSNIQIYNYLGDGVISTADVTTGSLLENLSGALSDYTIDVTSWILDPATQSSGFAGFNIRFENELANLVAQKSFADPNFNFGDGNPWLIVSYNAVVPIPAAAWLFGSGLLGLIGIARRKKTQIYKR